MAVPRSMRLIVAGIGLLACAGIGVCMPEYISLISNGLLSPIKGLLIALGGAMLAVACIRLLLQRSPRSKSFIAAAVLLVGALLWMDHSLFNYKPWLWLALLFAAIAAGAGIIVTRIGLAAAKPAI